YRVQQAEIYLEIEGYERSVFTLQRLATGALKERQLVVVHEGPAISSPDPGYKRSSYFVRAAGSARSEAGFHPLLFKFIGLELPELTDFEGEKIPLYLECIFAFFFVEQLTGWRDIKARMPTYLQIPEMAKRAAEFVMKLDILIRSLRRQELRQRAK